MSYHGGFGGGMNMNALMQQAKRMQEDMMNVEEDVASVGVQVILLVEDSIRFYSSMLPHLYRFVFKQSRSFMTEALNEHEQMLRMRGRPKILLARTYEEAMFLYEKYKNNMLGVITDVNLCIVAKYSSKNETNSPAVIVSSLIKKQPNKIRIIAPK